MHRPQLVIVIKHSTSISSSRGIATKRSFCSSSSLEVRSSEAMDPRSIGRTFEEYDAAVEWSRSAEADAVKISLPGFKREEIRVLVDNHGHLRTRGERPVAGNRWSRFQKDFQLPADCNVDGIRAKFENETLTITLPKKTPSPMMPSTPSPLTPPQPEPRRPPAAPLPGVRTPPSPPRRAPAPTPAPPPVPAPAPLPPALSQRLPAERRPAPVPEPVTRKRSDLGTLMKPKEDKVEETTKPLPPPPAAEEEEEEMMAREARGKMDEDQKKANEEVTDMAQLRRPVSASRRQLVNVAVAAVVLLGITLYVWNTLRNTATGGGAGDHGHGHGHASYRDEM